MLWTLVAVIAAGFTARRVLGQGPVTGANLGLAFVLGVAAGSAAAVAFGLASHAVQHSETFGERGFLAIIRRAPGVAALGAIAALAHLWLRARRRGLGDGR
jgi:hypothetical protein